MDKEEEVTIYHNGECSKCRGSLEIMQELGVAHTIRWYLAEPLSENELAALLKKLGMNPSELVRKSEPLYEGKEISDEEWLIILAENPILIERPIIEKGDKAVVARPAERMFEIVNTPNP
jgi:arsenate reductase